MEIIVFILLLYVAKIAFGIGWGCLQGALNIAKGYMLPSSTTKSEDSKES